MAPSRKHKVSIVCEGQQIFGWLDYEIASSMIEPADAFSMTRPWSQAAWNVLRRDARIKVYIDDTQVLDGFIDDRTKATKAGTLSIVGRDRAGRLVQESAPAINYNGLDLVEVVKRLVSPWFTKVTLTDARNRAVRTGKGFKVPIGDEPLVVRKIAQRGDAHPGQSRWSIIEELLSEAGLIGWSSADGREFFIGRPISRMAPQYAIRNCKPGSSIPSTCKDMTYVESNGDRYSLIAVVGNGGGTEVDFGESVSTRRAYVTDAEPPERPSKDIAGNAIAFDGTGRDFLYPKRLLMPERAYNNDNEASAAAGREQLRRDFKRTHLHAEMPFHGQWIGPGAPTIYAPNTIAAVLDEDFEPALDEDFLIYACTYSGRKDSGETTTLELVPEGTAVVL